MSYGMSYLSEIGWPEEPTEGTRMVGRGFRLGPGRGNGGLGKVVAVESREGVNLRVLEG